MLQILLLGKIPTTGTADVKEMLVDVNPTMCSELPLCQCVNEAQTQPDLD